MSGGLGFWDSGSRGSGFGGLGFWDSGSRGSGFRGLGFRGF